MRYIICCERTARETRRRAVVTALGRVLMSQFVPGSGIGHRERVAALRRALIVTDVQRVRPALLGLGLIVLRARREIGALRRVLQRLTGLRGRDRGLQQTGSLALIVLHAVIAFLYVIRVRELETIVLQLIAVS